MTYERVEHNHAGVKYVLHLQPSPLYSIESTIEMIASLCNVSLDAVLVANDKVKGPYVEVSAKVKQQLIIALERLLSHLHTLPLEERRVVCSRIVRHINALTDWM